MADRREHPMLMKGDLVVATLAGAKTQTRRLVTPRNSTVHGWPSTAKAWTRLDFARANTVTIRPLNRPDSPALSVPFKDAPDERALVFPRVHPGDSLWVRETFCVEHQVEGVVHNPPHDDGRPVRWLGDDESGDERTWEQPHYRATDPAPELLVAGPDGDEGCGVRWRPAIHMPRWACRLVLPVASVRAERVQAITAADASDNPWVWVYGWKP